ncbi:MAG: peptide-methionine (S)-S-oxide reductase MsrA [Pseudomonadota bacterium]
MTRIATAAVSALAAIVAALLFSANAQDATMTPAKADDGQTTASAVFAGGCFWCVEADFEKKDGVIKAVSGYTGGFLENPTYEQVTYERTGHFEAVKVFYDPTIVSYQELVRYFFRTIDPLDDEGQFCDKGASYRTAIFPANADERLTALDEKAAAAKELNAEIVTQVIDLGPFYQAEDYHQDY